MVFEYRTKGQFILYFNWSQPCQMLAGWRIALLHQSLFPGGKTVVVIHKVVVLGSRCEGDATSAVIGRPDACSDNCSVEPFVGHGMAVGKGGCVHVSVIHGRCIQALKRLRMSSGGG